MNVPLLTFGERIAFAAACEVIAAIIGIRNGWHPFAILGVAILVALAILVAGGWIGDGHPDDRCGDDCGQCFARGCRHHGRLVPSRDTGILSGVDTFTDSWDSTGDGSPDPTRE